MIRKSATASKDNIIIEGKAKIAVPKHKGIVSSAMPVFYNPVMRLNRDVTILLMAAAANIYGIKRWNIADAMAATGVRGVRILLEVGSSSVESLKMNDYSAPAVALIKRNLRLNGLKEGKKIAVANNEANKFLLNNRNFNYIDIDPFGYPGIFLDAAVKKVMHNGILAVTATDTSALAGTAPDACRRKYLAVPLKNGFMHETGIRILIRLVQLIGALHEKALIPVFSYYKDHYIRAFFLCKTGAHRVDGLLDMHKEMLYCGSCCEKRVGNEKDNFNCGNCEGKMEIAGPMWTGSLFDKKLAIRIAATAIANKAIDETEAAKPPLRIGFADAEMKEFLSVVAEEARCEEKCGVGFYAIERICEKHKVSQQPKTADVIKRLRQKGYAASPTHCTTTGVKTNAPVKQAVKAVRGR